MHDWQWLCMRLGWLLVEMGLLHLSQTMLTAYQMHKCQIEYQEYASQSLHWTGCFCILSAVQECQIVSSNKIFPWKLVTHSPLLNLRKSVLIMAIIFVISVNMWKIVPYLPDFVSSLHPTIPQNRQCCLFLVKNIN